MRIRLRLQWIVAFLLATSALAGSGMDRAAATPAVASFRCSGSWEQVPTLDATQNVNSLYGISAISASDVWTVGIKIPGGYTDPLIEHWDGTAWALILTPNVGAAELRGVDAISSSDVWAVGDRESSLATPLTEHWDGSAWNVVRTPAPGLGSFLTAVSASSSTDVWAVGGVQRSTGTRSLVLHWDGSAWRVVFSPSIPGRNTELYGVAALSANDAWAVGIGYDLHLNPTPVTMHWDGTSWTEIPPPFLDHEALLGVAGTASNDVWAVGNYGTPGLSQTLTLHWDGSVWSVVPSANPGSSWQDLNAVDAVSASTAWAVGTYANSGWEYPFVLKWDGTAWGVDPSPIPNLSNYNHLYGVSADSTTDAWAAGDFVDPARGEYSTLTEHECS
jgi:hypothetical protein